MTTQRGCHRRSDQHGRGCDGNPVRAGPVSRSCSVCYAQRPRRSEITGAEWQWSRSRSKGGSYNAIEDAEAATYSPVSGDVGFYLRATVTYTDGHGPDKSAMATSAHTVQAINEPNNAPVFPDQDLRHGWRPERYGDEDGRGEHGRG